MKDPGILKDSHRRRDQWWALVVRYNGLARLLPSEDDVRDDEDARATARLVLAEMRAVQAQMDAIRDAENESRRAAKPA